MEQTYLRPDKIACGEVCPPSYIICRDEGAYTALKWRYPNIEEWCEENKHYIIVFIPVKVNEEGQYPDLLEDQRANKRLFKPVHISQTGLTDDIMDQIVKDYCQMLIEALAEGQEGDIGLETFFIEADYLLANMRGDYYG